MVCTGDLGLYFQITSYHLKLIYSVLYYQTLIIPTFKLFCDGLT